MTKKKHTDMEYCEMDLPGFGRVMVPAHLSKAEVIAQLQSDEAPISKPKKGKAKA